MIQEGSFINYDTLKVDTVHTFEDHLSYIKELHTIENKQNPYLKGTAKKEIEGIDYLTPLLVLCLLGIAISRSFYRKRFKLLFKTIFNWKIAKQIIRYEKVYTHPVNLMLTGIFLISSPLFFGFFVGEGLFYSDNYFKTVVSIATALLAFLILKLLAHYFFAWLFNSKASIEEYIFQSSLVNKIYGIVNLALLICLLYTNLSISWLFTISFFFLLLLLIIQILRGFLIGLEKGTPIQLIILYLCTLEILPWFLMAKYLSQGLI
jgi:hypothetical protein